MLKQYYACVYGAASDKIDDNYKIQTEKLGNILADNGFSLVYGAGSTGCMGAVAKGVLEKDGHIMGIAPHFMSAFEERLKCDNIVMVDTMNERKILLEKHAKIFIITPGGIGTMDEFFQILTLKHLGQITTPIFILNTDGFYDSMFSFIDDLIAKKAVAETVPSLYEVIETPDDESLINCLKQIKNEQ